MPVWRGVSYATLWTIQSIATLFIPQWRGGEGRCRLRFRPAGAAPRLPPDLRRELERQFGPEWGAWVEDLGMRREELLRRDMSAKSRRRSLLQMVTPKAPKDRKEGADSG